MLVDTRPQWQREQEGDAAGRPADRAQPPGVAARPGVATRGSRRRPTTTSRGSSSARRATARASPRRRCRTSACATPRTSTAGSGPGRRRGCRWAEASALVASVRRGVQHGGFAAVGVQQSHHAAKNQPPDQAAVLTRRLPRQLVQRLLDPLHRHRVPGAHRVRVQRHPQLLDHPADLLQLRRRLDPGGQGRQLGRVLVGDDPYLGRPLRVAGRVGAQLVDPQLDGLQVAGESPSRAVPAAVTNPGLTRAFTWRVMSRRPSARTGAVRSVIRACTRCQTVSTPRTASSTCGRSCDASFARDQRAQLRVRRLVPRRPARCGHQRVGGRP